MELEPNTSLELCLGHEVYAGTLSAEEAYNILGEYDELPPTEYPDAA